LARRGSNVVYIIIPKSQEWLTINCATNDTGDVLLGFYIFRGERLRDDYINFCKLGTCMEMQKKTWMTTFMFKEFMYFFNKSILGGMSLNNRHLLILDGHGSHVTLEPIEQAKEFGLNILITLPSHTSHALQPLYVFCFKPFKTTFEKVRDASMSKKAKN
jgi:hypothetical protein